MNLHLIRLFAFFTMIAWSSTGFAQTALSLIEESENGKKSYWWETESPTFTDTDKELASAFRGKSTILIRPDKAISKVYRNQPLTEKSAKAIAAIFGASHVLFGKLNVEKMSEVVGFPGVRATLEIKVLGNASGSSIHYYKTSFFSTSPHEAGKEAKRAIAKQVAQYVSWQLKKKVNGDVGFSLASTELFIQGANAEELHKLQEVFKKNNATLLPIWSTEKGVAFKVNGVDAKAIVRIAQRAETSEFSFSLQKNGEGQVLKVRP